MLTYTSGRMKQTYIRVIKGRPHHRRNDARRSFERDGSRPGKGVRNCPGRDGAKGRDYEYAEMVVRELSGAHEPSSAVLSRFPGAWDPTHSEYRLEESMSEVRDRLRKAIEQQRPASAMRPRGAGDLAVEAFRPVRRAAEELRDEIKNLADLHVSIEPDSVGITLYDRYLWFSYDTAQRSFVGSETHSLWMEGGVREESYKWPTAEACIEAMIQAIARYVALAGSAAWLRSGQ
jgi:hypothetical protein